MKAAIKSKLNLQDRVALQDVIPLSTPYLLYIDPSSFCNFKCQFCPTGHKDLTDKSMYKRSVMDISFFMKIIDSLHVFPDPIKVLRLNKIGEPMVNKNLAKMVAYAKQSEKVLHIDFATNGSLLNPQRATELIESGIDCINISIEGVNAEQYFEVSGVSIDFNLLLENIRWLYAHKKQCEITIKIPKNYLHNDDEQTFYQLFGDCCDRIFVENLASIWPSFDIEKVSGIALSEEGQYGTKPTGKQVCSYIFYAAAINADGTVSACCPDWEQKLIVGDLKQQSLQKVWNSKLFNELRLLHLNGNRCSNKTCCECGHIRYSQVDDIDSYRELILQAMQEAAS